MSVAINKPLEKKLNIVAWVLTVVVLLLVGLMRQVKLPLPPGIDLTFLPAVNATLNAATAVTLLLSLYFIKQRNVYWHQRMNYLALGLSVFFLLGYVAYHFTTPETIFGDSNGDGLLSATETAAVGSWRTLYLVVLLTHIVLAAVILPFILFTFIRAYTGQFERHRRMARWVWPLWFYVAITGPFTYFMLAPYYP